MSPSTRECLQHILDETSYIWFHGKDWTAINPRLLGSDNAKDKC